VSSTRGSRLEASGGTRSQLPPSALPAWNGLRGCAPVRYRDPFVSGSPAPEARLCRRGGGAGHGVRSQGNVRKNPRRHSKKPTSSIATKNRNPIPPVTSKPFPLPRPLQSLKSAACPRTDHVDFWPSSASKVTCVGRRPPSWRGIFRVGHIIAASFVKRFLQSRFATSDLEHHGEKFLAVIGNPAAVGHVVAIPTGQGVVGIEVRQPNGRNVTGDAVHQQQSAALPHPRGRGGRVTGQVVVYAEGTADNKQPLSDVMGRVQGVWRGRPPTGRALSGRDICPRSDPRTP
jgi:hypothetical protein